MSRWNVSATGATENAFVVEEDDFDETGKLVVPIPESKKKIVLHRISHATISGIPDHVESISFHSCPGTTSIPKRLPSKLTSLTFIYTPIQFESVDDAMPERLLDLSIVASPLVFLPRVAPPKMRFLTIVGCANLTTLPRAVPASMHYVGIMDSGLVTEAEVLACVAPTHVHRNFDEFHFFVPRYPDAERKIKIIHDRYWTMVFMDAFRSKASGPPRSYPSDVSRTPSPIQLPPTEAQRVLARLRLAEAEARCAQARAELARWTLELENRERERAEAERELEGGR